MSRGKRSSVRVQKYISQAGVASRRQAEVMLGAGRIAINGEKVTSPGVRVVPGRDTVSVDGRVVRPAPRRWVVFHKPVGVLCTRADPHGGDTVYDLLPEWAGGLRYVGPAGPRHLRPAAAHQRRGPGGAARTSERPDRARIPGRCGGEGHRRSAPAPQTRSGAGGRSRTPEAGSPDRAGRGRVGSDPGPHGRAETRGPQDAEGGGAPGSDPGTHPVRSLPAGRAGARWLAARTPVRAGGRALRAESIGAQRPKIGTRLESGSPKQKPFQTQRQVACPSRRWKSSIIR